MKDLLERVNNHSFVTWFKQSDILIPIFIILILGMLIIPVPSIFLDVFIVMNIALSLGLLLIVVYINKAFEFSVFPTLLLIMTLFRLAVNISSTRLILFNGKDFDTEIILAFGEFVIQNNYVVGAIIFIILIAVQFIVIIKGATRVSEVAARFTLDAMPGKQMSVDSDLANGLITEKEAVLRRKELRKEVDFYGAMDGSSKFVQGDVRVGLVITFINFIGGIIIGVFSYNMSFREAFDVFFLLTVGDGLSAQIPSLLLSTATGIIVTRSISEQSLGKDISSQVKLNPKAIIITGTALILLSIVPGFPKFVLIIIGGLILGYGLIINQEINNEVQKIKEKRDFQKDDEDLKDIKSMGALIHIEPIEIEIGYNLIPFVDPNQGGDILDRIKMIRKNFALDIGLPIPPIRIRDNLKLSPEEYSIKIKGIVIDQGIIRVNKLLAIPSIGIEEEIYGEDAVEPAFKTKAKWIYPEIREEAESKGYSVVDGVSIISTHLMNVIKNNSHEILGRQEVKELLDSLKGKYPVIVEEALKVVNISKIQKVLHILLNEQVSIRNLVSILEVLTDYGDRIEKIEMLVNLVRERLARQICSQYAVNNTLRIYTLSTSLEELLENSIEESENGYETNLDFEIINKIMKSFIEGYRKASENGYEYVIAVPRNIRFVVKNLIQNKLPNIGILSYNELIPQYNIEKVGVIEIKED